MESLEIGMVLSDAGGALIVTGVGPTELPVAGCQRHWCGAPEAPVWDPESRRCGPQETLVSQRWRCKALRRVCVVPSQSPVKTFKGIVVGVLTPQSPETHAPGQGVFKRPERASREFQLPCGILEAGLALSGVTGSPQTHQCGAHIVQVGSRQMRL